MIQSNFLVPDSFINCKQLPPGRKETRKSTKMGKMQVGFWQRRLGAVSKWSGFAHPHRKSNGFIAKSFRKIQKSISRFSLIFLTFEGARVWFLWKSNKKTLWRINGVPFSHAILLFFWKKSRRFSVFAHCLFHKRKLTWGVNSLSRLSS